MLIAEMRMGLYVGCALSKTKMLNMLVFSVAIKSYVTHRKCSEMWMAVYTTSASEKNIVPVRCWIGSRHWYPLFSDKNQISNPHADASTWIVSIECPTSFSCQTIDLKKNNLDDSWTCSTNHASSHQTILLILILPHIWVFPAIFIYTSQSQPQPWIDIQGPVELSCQPEPVL